MLFCKGAGRDLEAEHPQHGIGACGWYGYPPIPSLKPAAPKKNGGLALHPTYHSEWYKAGGTGVEGFRIPSLWNWASRSPPRFRRFFGGTIVNYLHPGLQKWRTSHHLPQQVVWKGCRPRHQGLHSLACERWPPHQHRSYNEGREYHTVQVQCTQKYTTRTGGIGTEGRPSHPRPLSEGNCQCPRHYWKATITSVILPLFISWKVLVMSFNFFLFPDHN